MVIIKKSLAFERTEYTLFVSPLNEFDGFEIASNV